MKRFIILLAVALSSAANLFSQTRSEENDGFVNAFEADSVVWKSCLELDVPGLENPISETILYGDTTINEVKWKIVHICKGVTSLVPGVKGLVRTEDVKVIFKPYPGFENYFGDYDYPEETVLFDSSLEVGDSIGLYTVITSIDSIYLNDGKKHLSYMVEGFGSLSYMIEGLGSDIYDTFELLFSSMPTMPSLSTLMCCHVNGELLYMNPRYLDCEGNRVANEIIGDNNPKPTVVFADGNLQVTFDDDALFDVAVYNMQGMMLSQMKNNRNTMFANLNNLPKGVYVVKVHSDNCVYSTKIVK